MATYITLGKFTEQGMRSIQDTANRADAVRCSVTSRDAVSAAARRT